MQIYLWEERKCGLAGTEEMNNVIVEKRFDYTYIYLSDSGVLSVI